LFQDSNLSFDFGSSFFDSFNSFFGNFNVLGQDGKLGSGGKLVNSSKESFYDSLFHNSRSAGSELDLVVFDGSSGDGYNLSCSLYDSKCSLELSDHVVVLLHVARSARIFQDLALISQSY
jgi:hypothetical protein